MLVLDLGKWMNKILIDWGIDAKVADRFDETIMVHPRIALVESFNPSNSSLKYSSSLNP